LLEKVRKIKRANGTHNAFKYFHDEAAYDLASPFIIGIAFGFPPVQVSNKLF
jgi:hypothetical protein